MLFVRSFAMGSWWDAHVAPIITVNNPCQLNKQDIVLSTLGRRVFAASQCATDQTSKASRLAACQITTHSRNVASRNILPYFSYKNASNSRGLCLLKTQCPSMNKSPILWLPWPMMMLSRWKDWPHVLESQRQAMWDCVPDSGVRGPTVSSFVLQHMVLSLEERPSMALKQSMVSTWVYSLICIAVCWIVVVIPAWAVPNYPISPQHYLLQQQLPS